MTVPAAVRARVLLRGLGFAVWTLLWFVLRAGIRPLGLLFPRAAEALHRRSARSWARGLARMACMRVEVVGTPPQPPFVLVANHVSYVDIVALWTAVDGDFVAKSEIAGWPVLGLLTRSAGTVFVDRDRRGDLPRVLGELEGVLRRRRGVIVFPEGRSSDGSGVQPFRSSMFEVAVRAGYPVHCAALSYTTPPGSEPACTSICWWGGQALFPHLGRFLRLPRFEARVEFLPGPLEGVTRKELALEAQRRVSAAFQPMTGSLTAEPATSAR